jgi:hypothetical protein
VADTNAGGIHLSHYNPEIKNTIIWNNSSPGGQAIDTGYRHCQPIVTYCNIQGGWPGTGNIDIDPLFCGAEILDFHLSDISPCASSGENGSHMGALGVGCGATDTEDDEDLALLPDEFSLSQNYPNPFNPMTVIEYSLPHACNVRLQIYNILGRRVKTLVNDYQSAGYYSICWDGNSRNGRAAASGVYFYRINAGDFIESKKMLLLK